VAPSSPAPEHEVLLALSGITGPVSTAALVEAARANGASDRILETLRSLPERVWKSAEEAAADIGTGWGGS
jgi:hypothetical protein